MSCRNSQTKNLYSALFHPTLTTNPALPSAVHIKTRQNFAFPPLVDGLQWKCTMNLNNFTIKAQEAIARAQQVAFDNGSQY